MKANINEFFQNIEDLKKDEAGLLKGGFTTLNITPTSLKAEENVNVDVSKQLCACSCNGEVIILKPSDNPSAL